MDMNVIDIPDNYFDAAVSAFSIFFVKDLKKQLCHIIQKIKENCRFLMITFFENAFSSLVDFFLERLVRSGIKIPVLSWKRVAAKEQCTALFKRASGISCSCNS